MRVHFAYVVTLRLPVTACTGTLSTRASIAVLGIQRNVCENCGRSGCRRKTPDGNNCRLFEFNQPITDGDAPPAKAGNRMTAAMPRKLDLIPRERFCERAGYGNADENCSGDNFSCGRDDYGGSALCVTSGGVSNIQPNDTAPLQLHRSFSRT